LLHILSFLLRSTELVHAFLKIRGLLLKTFQLSDALLGVLCLLLNSFKFHHTSLKVLCLLIDASKFHQTSLCILRFFLDDLEPQNLLLQILGFFFETFQLCNSSFRFSCFQLQANHVVQLFLLFGAFFLRVLRLLPRLLQLSFCPLGVSFRTAQSTQTLLHPFLSFHQLVYAMLLLLNLLLHNPQPRNLHGQASRSFLFRLEVSRELISIAVLLLCQPVLLLCAPM